MRNTYKGFTLVELMITVAIVAIVLGIAIPSFQSSIRNNQSVALGEDFASAINYVRSEAVKRATRVSLCASINGESCGGAWTDGFIAFVDAATTDKATVPVVGSVLRVWGKQDPNALISVENNGAAATFIRYTSLGTAARITNNPYVINTSLKNCSGNAARSITIGLSGMVSVQQALCSTGS